MEVSGPEWSKVKNEVAERFNDEKPETLQKKVDLNGIQSLKTILMDNIKKIQDDKAFIPQAAEINNQVKSYIDIVKTEIEVIKILKS